LKRRVVLIEMLAVEERRRKMEVKMVC